MRQRQWLIALTILLTVVAVCTTPWPGQFARYLAPILPLLLVAVLAPLREMFDYTRGLLHIPTEKFKIFPRSVVAIIFCECVIAFQSGNRNFLNTAFYRDADGQMKSYHVLHYSAAYPQTEAALKWLMSRADAHAVLAVSMPQWVYLQSGLKTVMPPLTTDPNQAQKLIDTVPVSFVVIEKLLMDDNFNTYFPKLVEHSPDKWKLVYSTQDGQVRLYGRIGVARLSGSPLTG
jgi:hypothetical protein